MDIKREKFGLSVLSIKSSLLWDNHEQYGWTDYRSNTCEVGFMTESKTELIASVTDKIKWFSPQAAESSLFYLRFIFINKVEAAAISKPLTQKWKRYWLGGCNHNWK